MDSHPPQATERDLFTVRDLRSLSLPTMVLAAGAILAVALEFALLPPGAPQRWPLLIILIAVILSAYGQYVWLLPLFPRYRWLPYLQALLNGAAIPFLSTWLPMYGEIMFYVLAAATLVFIAIAHGRLSAYLYLSTSVLVGFYWAYPRLHPPYPPSTYFIQLGLVALGIAETALYARHMLVIHIRNLRTLNRIAHALASSIDRERVVEMVKEAIQSSIPADTYFLGLLQGEVLRLELLYDDGQFYPPSILPREGGLGGWVLKHRQTLRLNNIPAELPYLGVNRRIVGKQRVNLSWMGTPLESGGHLLGLIAVGAYRTNAFSRTDQELLENVARQIALALDNANHHAEVEEQARRDSLTGAYNHGYFLQRLHELCAEARQAQTPLCVIMLDIDHFKRYNDTYGHMLGDEVLRVTVQTIRRFIKKTDVVGRWGGEEFAIALPRANLTQAIQVAERIRRTMAHFTLTGRDGQPIPAPTVSQGVAEFPREGEDPFLLIDLADRRLYQAKEQGRNQIFPPPEATEPNRG